MAEPVVRHGCWVTEELRSTGRTAVRRHAERGHYDLEGALAILDEAHIAHVGFVIDGEPRVLPMAYGRVDQHLYLHGAVGNAMLRGASGAQVCVTVTLLDGLVMARSAFHHSMNYRSVVLLGRAEVVDDRSEKRQSLDAVVDHAVPERSSVARPVDDSELRQTLVLRLAIDEGSTKVRIGGPVDDPADMDHPAWAGVIPLRTVVGDPEQDEVQASGAGASLARPTLRSR